MSDDKPKQEGRIAIIVGWVLTCFAALSALGYCIIPHTRDYAIENLLTKPTVSAFAGTMGLIIGANIFTLPPLILGIYAYKLKHNLKGFDIIRISIIIFLVITVRSFMPSTSN